MGCEHEPTTVTFPYRTPPSHFPDLEIPADNQLNETRVELGKKLFYDNVLSRTETINCGSCHQAEYAFGDNQSFSPGVEDRPGTRNSISLTNVAYHPYFLREGGVPTLEQQILVPIQEHNEFDFNIVLIAERLNAIPEYVEMSQAAYDRNPDPFVITRSIAAFERTLISGSSPYDEYINGNTAALSSDAIEGMNLFNDLHCNSCHSGFNFTNYEITNNGLYENYADDGKYRLTLDENDRATFKTPSLRNVALTAPYMHDGSIHTLDEVIDHYASGGADHPNKGLISPFQITELEKTHLIRFLESLTDLSFTSDPRLVP